jgi:hypothetical protein
MQLLERLLTTDPEDAGCDETRRVLHIYAEAALTGRAPDLRYPHVGAHLRGCPPCADELQGLLAAVTVVS